MLTVVKVTKAQSSFMQTEKSHRFHCNTRKNDNWNYIVRTRTLENDSTRDMCHFMRGKSGGLF